MITSTDRETPVSESIEKEISAERKFPLKRKPYNIPMKINSIRNCSAWINRSWTNLRPKQF